MSLRLSLWRAGRGRLVFKPWFLGASILWAALCFGGCSEEQGGREPVDEERVVEELSADFDQRVIISTSVLKFRLRHTDRVVAESAEVKFKGVRGDSGAWEHSYQGMLGRAGDVGDIVVTLPVKSGLWGDLIGRSPAEDAEASFEGQIELELSDSLGVAMRAEIPQVYLEAKAKLEPRLDEISVGEVYPGEKIPVEGAGFLRPEEGESLAVIDSGEVRYQDGERRDISGAELSLAWSGQRGRADFWIDPAVFGVQVAEFSARFHLENHLSDASVWRDSASFEVNGRLAQPYLAELSPLAASRGEKINAVGRGLVGTDSDAGYGMYFRYEGVLKPQDASLDEQVFEGEDALLRTPDEVLDEQRAEQSVWYEIAEDRTLSGLGAAPATFQGSITPVLFDARGEQVGVGWQGEFQVLPTKQVVYLKYLPSFSTGLDKYGLRNVELEIRRRIKEVAERDYEGINVEFRVEPPDDFVDYTTVELGGPDPSGYQSFGYDNSFNGVAKDTGNLYLADYLGGLNADSGQTYNNPYGGIFLESFSVFSAELNPDFPMASEEFDRIMRPFMPALGGEPVRGTEWPEGPRKEEISAAVLMVGNVLGNTLTHELGHALGLAFMPEDEQEPTEIFHNLEPGPYIMNPGQERPFEMRAELNGQGPAVFNEQNYNYLIKYLPLND